MLPSSLAVYIVVRVRNRQPGTNAIPVVRMIKALGRRLTAAKLAGVGRASRWDHNAISLGAC
jgi:hypothetical protein